MKYHQLAIPGRGYCGHYAFAMGLIKLIKSGDYQLPIAYESHFIDEFKKNTVHTEVVNEIKDSSFVKRHLSMTPEDFISTILETLNIQQISRINELVARVETIEQVYATTYAIGVALARLDGYKKYVSNIDLSKVAYECKVNLTECYVDVENRANFNYWYNKNEKIKITVSYSHDDCHFEFLMPIGQGFFVEGEFKAVINTVDLSNRKNEDVSNLDYLTKMTQSLVTNNRHQFFNNRVVILSAAAALVSVYSYHCNSKND